MTQTERVVYHKKMQRRHARIQKIKQARRWQGVLSWKTHRM